MVPFLEQVHNGESAPKRPARVARVQVVLPGDSSANPFIELLVDLEDSTILKKEHLIGKHPYIDSDYMKAAEKACMSDPKVQEEIAHLQLPDGATVVVESWAYATDGTKDMSQRTTMVSIYHHDRKVQGLDVDISHSAGFTCAWWMTPMRITTPIHSISARRYQRT